MLSTTTDRTGRAERADNRSRDCEVRNIQKKGRHSTNVDFEQKEKGGTQMTHKQTNTYFVRQVK